MAQLDRRRLVLMLAAAPSAPALAGADLADDTAAVGRPLGPWRPGTLEIHHLATGRGDCALVICPDGSSLMIDAGASASDPDLTTAARPSAAYRPGQWIARYARRRLPRPVLNDLVVTHLHPDHLGDPAGAPLAASGAFRLTGVSDVAAALPVETVFDRGWPNYAYSPPPRAPFADNYLAFMRSRAAAGLQNRRIRAGQVLRSSQGPAAAFEVRAVACDGQVWTGEGQAARATFPPLAELAPQDRPTENMCSAALRIAFGRFSYFTGGDLTSDTQDGALPWADIEGAAARACGPVDVAVACHHGYFDAVGAAAVTTLRPRVWITQAWHVSHPGMKPLERMFSQRLYLGPRELFLTQATPEALKVGARFLKAARSVSGHVVVRVQPSGRYQVFVTDSFAETDQVLLACGPYDAKSPLRI